MKKLTRQTSTVKEAESFPELFLNGTRKTDTYFQ